MSGVGKTDVKVTINTLSQGAGKRAGEIKFLLDGKDYRSTMTVEQYDYQYGDGDVITIPEYNGSVRVMGAVTYPNTVTFKEKKDLKYYINASGGFEKYARKKKSFVIYMNGMVATGKRAEVRPGCIIIVPAKTVSNAEPIKWNEVIGMLSSSASTAAVVLSAISLSSK
jgi:protein involved in polysaccharide export with SLBB domain